ncbi:sensor histidine kinase [Winogradskyella psychrotolerans]|uniref:sensor histidine kinase n=1 Tax=Winogradskyella psychrotolerans TaxID=1344585 RepID=UPI001C078AAD|nr:sensor histidine kinase [Winogradskyella psychrotolerans]MBU2921605.1 sensor histidine kinase [Winogradskyella psychrotolerans]
MKLVIAFLWCLALYPFKISAQNLSFSSFYNETDNYVRYHSPKESLDYIDSLLIENSNYSSKQTLNTVKLFPLIQANMYDVALQTSKSLLHDSRLSKKYKIITHLRRALIYEILEIFDKSEIELKHAEIILSEPKFIKSELKAELLYRYGSLYRVQEKYGLANNYVDQSITLSKENNYINSLAVAYMLKGFLTPKNEFDAINNYYNDALKNYKMHNDSLGVSGMLYNLGKLYFKKEAYNKALDLSDSVIKYANKFPYHFAYANAYKLKSDIYKKKNLPDSALRNFEIFYKLDTKLLEDKQELKIRELEYNYLLEQEHINKKQLEKDNKEISRFNYKLKMLIYSLITLLILITIAFRFIWKKNKTIRENKLQIFNTNKKLSEMIKEKEVLLKELNHRVKNNLSLILSLINFQSIDIKDTKLKSRFETLKQRIEAIAIVHKQMMFKSDSNLDNKHNIKEYINQIAHSLIKLDPRTIIFQPQILNIEVSLDVAIPLGILINELISNSIKHAVIDEELEINIHISEEEEFLKIIYSDNGKSFKIEKQSSGLGLFIIESMVKQLKGSLKVSEFQYNIKILKARL